MHHWPALRNSVWPLIGQPRAESVVTVGERAFDAAGLTAADFDLAAAIDAAAASFGALLDRLLGPWGS